ncbi:uncharacterized protein LOC129606003 [Condylostylus longicornis]|uniref:uncharacterized protein LOC129606003 n=1 Tax=Condylostylus longicornis TaxID=2530218 RepID=UPI00244DE493|nr:uncharacterized protein LOC129606003 [Condylostylus longicornis]XP_055372023.1 uncharacterized protein LOC129606003 [Condylostylus longicornis]
MCSLTKLNFKYQSRKDSTKTRTILSSTIRIKSSSSTIDDSTAKTTAQEQLESRLLGIKYPEDNLINRIRTNKIQRNSRKSILENFELNNNSYYSNLYYDKNNIYNNGNESSKNCCRAYIKSPTIISAVTTPLKMWNIFLIILIIFLSQRIVLCVDAMHWDHDVQLNEDFRLLWSVTPQDITFEIQVRALGYVGLGFSYDGNIPGADMAIGWVDRGQPYFQVTRMSFIKLYNNFWSVSL